MKELISLKNQIEESNKKSSLVLRNFKRSRFLVKSISSKRILNETFPIECKNNSLFNYDR